MATNLAYPDRDRHVRRSGREYLSAFLRLLPLGIAWPRKPDSVLVKTSRGLTNVWGFVDNRAADLLEREADPRYTIELLPEWERAWGLPDPCFPGTWITTWHPGDYEYLGTFSHVNGVIYDSYAGNITEVDAPPDENGLQTHYIQDLFEFLSAGGKFRLTVEWRGIGPTNRSLIVQLSTQTSRVWLGESGAGTDEYAFSIINSTVTDLGDGFMRSILDVTVAAEGLHSCELILAAPDGVVDYPGLNDGSGVHIRSASLRELIARQQFVQPPIGDRQRMLVKIMTMLGRQSRQWFKELGDWIGFPIHMEQWEEKDANGNVIAVHNSSFHEWSPFMAGISHVGDTRMQYDNSGYYRWEIGPPEMRFYWTVQPAIAAVIWFRAGSGQAGVDPHVRVGVAQDLACLFRRWKPAHTELVFDYSSLTAGGPMQGTP